MELQSTLIVSNINYGGNNDPAKEFMNSFRNIFRTDDFTCTKKHIKIIHDTILVPTFNLSRMRRDEFRRCLTYFQNYLYLKDNIIHYLTLHRNQILVNLLNQ